MGVDEAYPPRPSARSHSWLAARGRSRRSAASSLSTRPPGFRNGPAIIRDASGMKDLFSVRERYPGTIRRLKKLYGGSPWNGSCFNAVRTMPRPLSILAAALLALAATHTAADEGAAVARVDALLGDPEHLVAWLR